jgi:hypothetical protein
MSLYRNIASVCPRCCEFTTYPAILNTRVCVSMWKERKLLSCLKEYEYIHILNIFFDAVFRQLWHMGMKRESKNANLQLWKLEGLTTKNYFQGRHLKRTNHRYLMTRLSLQVFYLWRHVSATAPPPILWWSKFRNTICPPPPQLSLHRRAALSSNSNGTQHIAERTQKAVYIVRCLWYKHVVFRKP